MKYLPQYGCYQLTLGEVIRIPTHVVLCYSDHPEDVINSERRRELLQREFPEHILENYSNLAIYPEEFTKHPYLAKQFMFDLLRA